MLDCHFKTSKYFLYPSSETTTIKLFNYFNLLKKKGVHTGSVAPSLKQLQQQKKQYKPVHWLAVYYLAIYSEN